VKSTIVGNTNSESTSCDVGEQVVGVDDDPKVAPAQQNPANVNAVDEFASFGTVVARASGGVNCEVLTPGSLGYNYSDDTTCGFTGTGDRQGAADPQLGALAANGGPTLTMLPASTSPLLDAIPVGACAGPEPGVDDDQRGIARPQGTGCDVGAVEVEVVIPVVIQPTFTG
jgi:hypothetical protein